MHNLATVHEAIAEAIPDRECLVFRDRRFTWAQVTERTRRLASVLRAHGLGCHKERPALENSESGQDHVALYLLNGNEYLEGMLGAFKSRTAPFNVNYRYVDEELLYLFNDAKARCVIYHARFAPTLARIRESLSDVKLWLQVEDGYGEALLPGAIDYEQALAGAAPEPPRDLSPDDLYILYTGGTTGMPKGVLWRQGDLFAGALYSGEFGSVKEVAEIAASKKPVVLLPSPPFMHGAAQWTSFHVWHTGGTIAVQSDPTRLDPDDIWSTVEREKVKSLSIVGDAFARPLLDQLRRKEYDISSLKLVNSGGAIFTAALKQELIDLAPHVRILDGLGSSETGSQAFKLSGKGSVGSGDFDMNPDSVVLKEDHSGLVQAGSDERGWLARRGHVPLGYFEDPQKTAKTFPVVGGVRYSVPGDRASLDANGTLILHGRDSVTINSGGEKIFAEEVEQALKHHPAVYDTVVVPTPSERWGQQVTAIVLLREGVKVSEEDLKETAKEHIAAYKLPKAYVYVDAITRAPSGKPDYRWARATAEEKLGLPSSS